MSVKSASDHLAHVHAALEGYLKALPDTWTEAQTQEVNRRMAELKAARAELDQAESEEARASARAAEERLLADPNLRALERVIGSTKTSGPSAKAAPWGDAVIRASSGPHGFKALVPAGATIVAVPAPPLVELGRPVRSLLQLIPRTPTAGGVFSYLRQNGRTNNAAPVAEGALKPTSVLSTELVEDRARTIAHLSEAIPRQQLADAELLRRFVEAELRLGLETALETQIVTGDGTGENFTGLANVAGSQAQAWDTDLLTTTRKAVTALESQDLPAGGFAFHPNDWEAIELLQDNEARYYGGGPVDRASRRLWGVPVAVTSAVPAGTGYLADFEGSTRLWVREEAEVSWSEAVNDDFSKNLVRMRAEGRFGFGVLRPAGVVEIDLTAV